jgi:hypothetical protein
MSTVQVQLDRLKNLSPAKREALFKTLHAERLRDAEKRNGQHRNRTGHAPLSVAQRHLFLLDQEFPSVPTYNVPIAVRITDALNVAYLERSLNDVIRRHDVLRTKFQIISGHPVQSVDQDFSIRIAVEDLTTAPTTPAAIRAIVLEEGKRPFDLRLGPPIRVRVLRISEQEHLAMITLHHILCDGQSLEIFMRDLSAFYAAAVSGRPAELPELRMQYGDFVDWEAGWLASQQAARQIAYWKKQLQGVSGNELPLDMPRPFAPAPEGKRIYFEFSGELQKALEVVAHESGTTLMGATLAVFQLILRTWAGHDSISIGAPVDNRTQPEFEQMMGLFINTVVFRTGLSGEDTFRELLKRTRETVLSAHSHKHMPFEAVLQELGLEHDPPRKPLFQSWFVFQVVPPQRRMIADIEFASIQLDYKLSRYDVKLNVFAGTSSIKCSFEYNTSLFAPETIKRICRWYQLALQRVAQQPEIRCDQLSSWLRESDPALLEHSC